MGVSVKQLPLIIVLLALYNGDVKCDELVDQNVPEDSQYSTNLHRDGQNEYNSTTVEPWFQPRAWSSTRLYPWGPNDNVKCTGFGRPNDTYEYYSHWRYCDSVSINGNLGFPFQNITYNEVYVCGNGMVQFGYSYMRTYPYLHGRKRSFSLYGLTGAFWGDSDQISLDEYSEAINEEKAKTRVYYQEYQVGDELSEDGKAAMERAQYDVHSIAPSGFTPTSLLVVTAVNVAPSKKSCFHHGTNAKLYEHLIAKYYERCFRGWCNSDGAAEWKTLYEQRLSYYRRKSHGCSKNIQSDNWKNHYQTVLITDGYYSFIKFNYPEEGINWVHPDISNYTREFWELFNKYSHSPIYSMSVGGWTASANQQNSSTSFNVLNSGEIWFESVDTYSSWWSTDANNQMINDMSGEYVSIVASYSGISTEIQVCHELLEKMSKRHTSAEMDSFVKKYPCARNLADVLWDEGTFIFHSYHYTTGRYCVYRRVAWSYFGNERSLCCYSMDTNGPENLYLVEGVKLRGGHITDITDGYEEQAKDACCNISIKYCQEFYKSRLPTSSDGYIPVRRVAVRGDPHFTTLDGVDYSFNGQGEFLIFGNSIEEGTIIQARTTRISDNNGALTQATCIQAVAIKFRSFGALQVEKTNSTSAQELGLSSGLLVYFEGRAVNVSGLVSGDRSQTLEGVTSYYRFDRTDDSILIISPDGVQLNVSSAQGLMYFVITVPSDHLNSTEGLLGFYDGNPDNDFMYPERAFHLTERADYWSRYYWAKKWTVSPVASILQYPEGSTPSDYITSPFLPLFIEHLSNFNWNNTELKQRATTECDGNEECLFDVYVTGLLDVGLSTRRIKEETNAITAFLENQPPRINGPSTVDIQKLTALVVRLEIVDEDVKSVIVRATPEELIAISPTHLSSLGLVNITIKTYLFNITESFEFAVIATDEFGKSTIYQPILAYCDCQNGGFCLEQVTDEDLLTSSTNTVIRTCTCLEGWTGQLCETDLDACALSADSCFPGAVCTDKPPPEGIDGFECSGCPPGYEGDGKHCSDINECLNPNYGVCDHECFNAAGSFGCLCNEGYKLTDDRLTCVEVWVRPAAWSSARLYPWGYNARDSIKSTGDGYPMNSSEYYSNWRYCDPVSINGKLGFPFKNRTFIEVYVCGNGMVQFGYNYMWTYPYLHGSHSYFTDYGLAGAFWGNSDQISQDEFAKNINQSDAKTKIFYQEHRDNESLSSDSRTVLMRAKHDVLSVAPPGTDFTPTSVLVITAINIAPNRNYCFHYTTGVKLYEHLIAKYYEHCFGDWCNRDDAQSWRTHYYEKLRYYKEQSIDCAIIQADTLRNHFQTVLITDGYYSFIKFNYPEQGINWVHPDVKEHSVNYRELFYTNSRSIYSMSVGGWSSPDSTYNNTQHDSFNVPDSGHLLFESVDSVKGSAGEHVSRVDSYNGISTNRQSCREFLQSISQTQSPAEMESFIREYPCAGSLSETMWDAGRFKFHSYEYRRRRYCLYRQKRWSYSGNHRALCCYNLNAEEPGYLLLIQGVKQQGGHITDITDEREAEARSVCCSVSFEFCREFYAARPPTSAVGFTPVRRVVARGDPHFTTLDGVDYTFNEQGEYLIFSNGQETGTVIQARTARVHDINGDLTLATRFKAVALQFKNFGAIQFEQENSSVDHISCFVMFFDGAAVNFSGLAIGDTTQTLEGVASYYRFDRTDNSILIISPDGVQLNVSSAQGFMYFAVTVHEDNINSTEGLLGYYDGNPDNDFMYPGRAFHLTKRADHWSRYYWARAWAVAWRVSILRYPEGKTQQDYIGYSFPLFIERLSRFTWANEELKQQATTECDDSEECLFDVYVTGLLDVGLGTKRIWEESRALTTYLENEAPRIDGPSLVYITNNSTSITLQISDKDITTVNISVFPADLAVPDSYGITPEGFISITIQLDLFQINQDLELSVMAVDTFGKTTVYQPTLAYCGCKNGGSCLELTTADDIEMSSTRTIMRTCTCLEGWTGQLCETDLDACALSADSCFPGVLCTDKPPPEEIDGFDCGRCPAGYEGDGKHCSDIDECLDSGYGVCDHECFNAAGSFGCLCFEGFTLNEDGFSCDDIDECQLDICHQHCNNTHGSFICSCVDGWNLLSNNIDCKPANLYKLTNICDHRQEMGWSVRTPNSTSSRYTCVCNRGYQTASNGINCEDIDECSLPTSPCEDTCINEKGGYTCTCPTGFRLGRYGLMCEEQNECGIFGSGLCLQGMLCVDTREGYTCVCPDGSIQEESAGCILLSDDEPSPPSLVPASSEDLASSVVVTFKQLPSILFTVKKRREMYTFIAEVLPNFCGGDGECPAHTRKKRNPSSKQTFYSQDQIITVEGFPSSVGNDLEIAFFVYHASKGYVPASTLKAAIENTQTEIEAIAGAKLTVRDTFEVTPTHTPFIAAQGDAIIAIAAFCGLLMLGLLVFMIIAWRKNKHIVKVDSVPATIVKKEKSKLDEGRLTKVSV